MADDLSYGEILNQRELSYPSLPATLCGLHNVPILPNRLHNLFLYFLYTFGLFTLDDFPPLMEKKRTKFKEWTCCFFHTVTFPCKSMGNQAFKLQKAWQVTGALLWKKRKECRARQLLKVSSESVSRGWSPVLSHSLILSINQSIHTLLSVQFLSLSPG